MTQADSEKHEKDLIRFLKTLGFRNVDGGSKFYIGDRQVDSCGGHEKTLIIVECTTQKDIGSKLDSFHGRANEIIRGLRKEKKFSGYDKYKLVLAVRGVEISEADRLRARKKEPIVHIWDDAFIQYYLSLYSTIRDSAKFSLLAELGVKPEKEETVELPAFSIDLGKKTYRMFIFVIEARKLKQFAYVARREAGGETYYQRMVQKSRLTKIGKYIDKGLVFPNSIVIALSDGYWQFHQLPLGVDVPGWQDFGRLTLDRSFSTCWIIDGQHRLYGHDYSTRPGKLIVTAFANISEDRQAEYFLDINKEAKKVDVNLLWDLLGSINPCSSEGVVSNAAKILRGLKGSIFESNIRIPSLGDGMFSFNNICVNLEESELGGEHIARRYKVRTNPFYNNDPSLFSSTLARGVNQFFESLDSALDQDKKEYLFTDGFIAVMIRIYKLLVVHLAKRPTAADLDIPVKILAKYLNLYSKEDCKKLRKSLASIGGKTDFRNDLVQLLQESYTSEFGVGLTEKTESLAEKIARLEIDLNRLVNAIYSLEYGPTWISTPGIITDAQLKSNIIARAKRDDLQPWEYLPFSYTVHNLIVHPTMWPKYFEQLFMQNGIDKPESAKVYASNLWGYRSNKLGHKRSKPVIYTREEEDLTNSIYKIFRRIIDAGNDKWNLE